jgi:hypothetical protein
MNTDNLTPDTPRPFRRCGAMVGPSQDARWRDAAIVTAVKIGYLPGHIHASRISVANRLDVHEHQQRIRPRKGN